MKNTLKDRFIEDFSKLNMPRLIAVTIELPTGATEAIINTDQTISKAMYYINMYDEEFRLKANKDIKIISYMIV